MTLRSGTARPDDGASHLDATPVVDYAPPAGIRWRRWVTRICIAATIIAIVWSTWVWTGTLRRRIALVYWQSRCLNYQGPVDQSPMGVPRCWEKYAAAYRRKVVSAYEVVRYTGQLALLHGRTTESGRSVLLALGGTVVSINPQPWESDQRPFYYVDLNDGDLLTLGSLTRDPISDELLGGNVDLGRAHNASIFNGQPDPNDPTHFTIGYDMDGKKGTIDGWLKEDGVLELKLRDGPAAEQQGIGEEMDRTKRKWAGRIARPVVKCQ